MYLWKLYLFKNNNILLILKIAKVDGLETMTQTKEIFFYIMFIKGICIIIQFFKFTIKITQELEYTCYF